MNMTEGAECSVRSRQVSAISLYCLHDLSSRFITDDMLNTAHHSLTGPEPGATDHKMELV